MKRMIFTIFIRCIFLATCLLLVQIPCIAKENSIWQHYELDIKKTQNNNKQTISHEIFGPSYDFKLAKKFVAEGFPDIRHVTLITPENKNNATIIPIIIIKGTWARDHHFCDISNNVFKGFLQFAKDIASKYKSRVELITFTWSAKNLNNERTKAANRLANFINHYYLDTKQYPLLYFIGHSHGGSIANAATHGVKREVSHVINLATPIRQNACFKPTNYQFFYQFYTQGDIVQWLGSGKRTRIKSLSTRCYSNTELHNKKSFHSIFTKFDGAETDHYHIKLLAWKLSPILDFIETNYKKSPHLVLNLILNNKKYHSSERQQLVTEHPILMTPYHPQKNPAIQTIDSNPKKTKEQLFLFKKIYPQKSFSARNRTSECIRNFSLFWMITLRNLSRGFKQVCNPKLNKIPGE